MALTQVQGAMVGPTGFANLSGITFPATQVPSADANTLDDYEEGTWTPTAIGATTAGTTSYASRYGNYTKIGNTVTANGYMSINSATGTGFMLLSLPFSCNVSYNSMGSVLTWNLDWPDTGSLCLWVVANQAYARVHVSRDNQADVVCTPENAEFEVNYTVTYQV